MAVYQTLSDLLVKTSGLKLTNNQFEKTDIKILMLLHGWGMNSHVWEPIRNALEARYHILWVDLPGHGFNRHLRAESLENIVDLIAEVTPHETHVVAWSLGGMIGQALAQKIPDKIKSLNLVTSTPRFSQSPKGDWPYAMSNEVLDRFADSLKQNPEKTIKGFIALQFLGIKNAKVLQDNLIKHIVNAGNNGQKWGGVFLDGSVHDLESSIKQTDNIPTQEALDVGLSILKDTDLRSCKPSCHEHWIFAEYDRLIPKEVINDLISLRPNAQITLLEKSGHAPFITHPEIFIEHLNNFIDTQP